MNIMLWLIIAVAIVILLLHLAKQHKKGEHLEMCEMDYIDNKQLQEVCDLKQPVVFFMRHIEPAPFDKIRMNKGSFDVKVKNINDYEHVETDNNHNHNDKWGIVEMSMKSFAELMRTDANHIYFTENNYDYVDDAGLKPFCEMLDVHLKPRHDVIVQVKHDVVTGTRHAHTPLRYHINHRHFIAVIKGKISVKMTQWKSHKFLRTNADYCNWDFYATQIDDEKVNFIEFDVLEGNILFIPSNWWFSVKFEEENTVLCNLTYNSVINVLAHVGEWSKHYFCGNNDKHGSSQFLAITDDNDDKTPNSSPEEQSLLQPSTTLPSQQIQEHDEENNLQQQPHQQQQPHPETIK